MKGAVDLKWYGQFGFKIQFQDKDAVTRCIYIDIWLENPDCREEEKTGPPNDGDLVLVTQGQ